MVLCGEHGILENVTWYVKHHIWRFREYKEGQLELVFEGNFANYTFFKVQVHCIWLVVSLVDFHSSSWPSPNDYFH